MRERAGTGQTIGWKTPGKKREVEGLTMCHAPKSVIPKNVWV
ncbi:hypothetical protein [Paenibacillus gansuensis]|uniref:Uncharacterized protein n=1 Tax=Paenibacillus gansuensis TaxID=306542 RepID=A0ABW5PJB3_9BACL